MTTRDLFAAHAMRLIGESVIHASEPSDMAKTSNEDLAAWAYDLADAMMAERQKRKHPDGETTD